MKTKTSLLKKILYIIIPLAIIAIFVMKLKSNKKISDTKVFQYDKNQSFYVQADTIRLQNINDEFTYSGIFEPSKETKVSTEIPGKINQVYVEVGTVVNKGQTLIQLDHSLLKIQMQSIEVQIEGLKADVERYTILVKADAIQGVHLEKAILGLNAAKVQKASVLDQISKTTIKAPFKGIITSKLIEEGAFAAPGIPLIQITDIEILKFSLNISEIELKKFKMNESYGIEVDAYPDILLKGNVSLIGSKSNMGSSFPIQFMVNNTSDLKIKSGMFGKVTLKNSNQEKSILIPASAITGTANQPQVFVIKNGKSLLQNISISKRVQNNAVVSNGLNEGDVIVKNGFINLFDSANVTVK